MAKITLVEPKPKTLGWKALFRHDATFSEIVPQKFHRALKIIGIVLAIPFCTLLLLLVIGLSLDAYESQSKLDSSKATALCADKLRAEGGDFSMWKTGHTEDDFRFTVYAAGTIENVYGTKVKVTMVCLVNKLAYEETENKADVITSSVLRMGHV